MESEPIPSGLLTLLSFGAHSYLLTVRNALVILLYLRNGSIIEATRVTGDSASIFGQIIVTRPEALDAGQRAYVPIDGPWNFIKAQAKSAANGRPATVSDYLTLRR